jgi:hypothetical protein
MAASGDWFDAWFAAGYFPPVWFAKADEDEEAPPLPLVAGGFLYGREPKKKRRRPAMLYNPLPVIEPVRRPVEEAEALLLCGAV